MIKQKIKLNKKRIVRTYELLDKRIEEYCKVNKVEFSTLTREFWEEKTKNTNIFI